jgi:hypothetical protein
MTDALLLVADTDHPIDWSTLPAGCSIVLGYIGQPLCTPHVWTHTEVEECRSHGLIWAPIHTPPGGRFGKADGERAAALMLQELTRYRLYGPEPVFLDIEHSTWALDPAATMAGVRAWAAVMSAHGHTNAHAYLPWQAGTGWGANWVNYRPQSIPAGYAGWQYDHSHPGRHYDLSVFHPSVFAPLIAAVKGHPVPFDAQQEKFIVDQLTKVQDNLHKIMWAYYEDPDPKHPHPYAQRRLAERLDKLQTEVAKLPTATVDITALAALLSAQLGPRLAADLVSELSARLAH